MSDTNNNMFKQEQTPFDLNQSQQSSKVVDYSSSRTLGFVFLYLAIGVGITALISFFGGYGLVYLMESYSGNEVISGQIFIGYIISLIVSFILILILPWIVSAIARKRSVAVWVPYILYSIAFGVFIASFAFLIPPGIMGLAFIITTVTYLVMALIGILSKGSMKVLAQVAIGLSVGAMLTLTIGVLLFLFPAFFLSTFGVAEASMALYDGWNIIMIIVLAVIFLYCAIVTIVDINRIKKTAKQFEFNQGDLVFMAYICYGNYVTMLLIVLRFLVIIFARRR